MSSSSSSIFVISKRSKLPACFCSVCLYWLHCMEGASSAVLSSAACKGGSHFFTVHLCLQYVPNILLSWQTCACNVPASTLTRRTGCLEPFGWLGKCQISRRGVNQVSQDNHVLTNRRAGALTYAKKTMQHAREVWIFPHVLEIIMLWVYRFLLNIHIWCR